MDFRNIVLYRSLNTAMLGNYFKTATRNLSKNKFFTLLNVFSLALGMSISLMFIAMLTFLYRYDDFHADGDRIYRVTTLRRDNIENPRYASAPAGLVQKFRDELPAVEKVVEIQKGLEGVAIYGEKEINLSGYFAGTEFLEVFNFPLSRGDAATALSHPRSILLTEKEATKIFGNLDPVGETIAIAPYGDFIVTGILKDPPLNSHLMFGALASHATLLIGDVPHLILNEESWQNFINSFVYVRVAETTKVSDVEQFLDRVAEEKYTKGVDVETSFKLQALDQIVPSEDLVNPIGMTWDTFSVILMGILSMIILVPACSNYINMSISQSLMRMKEIGVRKVMGGQKIQIAFQFMMETTLTMLLALSASFFIFQLIRDEFLQQFVERDYLDLTPTFSTVIGFVLFAILAGLLAGIVPALYFSRITPVKALKGKPEISRGEMKIPLRKVMITTQFVLSLGLIMGMVIMLQQYRYSVTYDFGFEQSNLLDLELKKVDHQRFNAEFGKLGSVDRISMSSHLPGLGYLAGRYVRGIDQIDSVETGSMSIDENYLSNLELTLIAGKDFGNQVSENFHSIIVNEEFLKKLDIPDPMSAMGRYFVLDDGRQVSIRGVIRNFHYASLREPIGCFFFEYDDSHFRYANLKMTPDRYDSAAMQAAWTRIGGPDKFHAMYLTDEIEEAYSFYFVIVKLWGFLGLLAITVTCLGLLGTVVFTLRNRLKEVSIRKVMGASAESLVYLLSKDFIFLMAIASVITIPAAYYIFDFLLVSVQYYSIQIGFVEIAVSLGLVMLLGLSTIISQTRKAANANPVENLRTE